VGTRARVRGAQGAGRGGAARPGAGAPLREARLGSWLCAGSSHPNPNSSRPRRRAGLEEARAVPGQECFLSFLNKQIMNLIEQRTTQGIKIATGHSHCPTPGSSRAAEQQQQRLSSLAPWRRGNVGAQREPYPSRAGLRVRPTRGLPRLSESRVWGAASAKPSPSGPASLWLWDSCPLLGLSFPTCPAGCVACGCPAGRLLGRGPRAATAGLFVCVAAQTMARPLGSRPRSPPPLPLAAVAFFFWQAGREFGSRPPLPPPRPPPTPPPRGSREPLADANLQVCRALATRRRAAFAGRRRRAGRAPAAGGASGGDGAAQSPRPSRAPRYPPPNSPPTPPPPLQAGPERGAGARRGRGRRARARWRAGTSSLHCWATFATTRRAAASARRRRRRRCRLPAARARAGRAGGRRAAVRCFAAGRA
jgi:hypothetical protein